MAKSPEGGMASLHRNLLEQTGRSIDGWAAPARAAGPGKHEQIVAFLKADHGLSHGYANPVALRALTSAARSFGPDVEASPKKAHVSLRRSKQSAMVQPSTAKRVDVGLILKGVEPLGRLEASGSFHAMFTHRVRVGTPAEADAELVGWLRRAYDEA